MKKNYIIALLLIGFGIIAGLLRRGIFLKLAAGTSSAYAISFLSWTDFAEGFLVPGVIFATYFIVLRVSTQVFLSDDLSYLPMLIALSLVPRYLYLALNLWYLPGTSSAALQAIGAGGQDFIIPGISSDTAESLASSLILFPIIPYFFALWVRERKPLLGVLLAISAPMALVGFFLYLLEYL